MRRVSAVRALLLAVLAGFLADSAYALSFHGKFSGTADNFFGGCTLPPSTFNCPISEGDPFTLRLELDLVSQQLTTVELDIGGVTGTFGNTWLEIQDNIAGGTLDQITMLSNLDSPVGIFNGQDNSNVSFTFTGPSTIFSGTGLGQAFDLADFTNVTGSFDVNAAAYGGDLNFSSGFYAFGELPPVPLPPTALLFGSALAIIGWMRRKDA